MYSHHISKYLIILEGLFFLTASIKQHQDKAS